MSSTEHLSTKSRLGALFEPRAIAVIGVSEREAGVGRRVFENIRSGGYAGPVFAVNAKHRRVGDVTAYPSLGALPEPVELAVIAVPAAHVAASITDCGEHGVRFAIVLSAGFSETGPEGVALEQRVLDAARRAGVRLLGPNCLGLMRAKVALNASFSAGITVRGKLALVSQSGAVCSAIVDWAEARHIGFSTVVSLGAAADIGMGELLDYLALDHETDAILLYVEGVDHARSFMSGLRAAARLKPVVIVKTGRHARAGRAAASHTGAIVGNDAVFDAAVRRAGAVRVGELQQLFAAAEALSHTEPAVGDRLAIVTNAGGLGVLAVDRAEDLGIPVATLRDETRSALAQLLPAHASRDNPIDILGDAPPERYGQALDLCLRDPGIDGIIVLLSPQLMTRPREVATAIAERENEARVPIFAAFMGGQQIEPARKALFEHEVSCFDSPEAAVEAFDTLLKFRRNQRLLLEVPSARATEAEPDLAAARSIVSTALAAGRTLLSQLEAKALLEAFGIACVPAARAKDAAQASEVAARLGFPVALKIDSPDITHKSEVKGVRLGIADAQQLGREYAALMSDVRARAPGARIEGVVVEAMLARRESRELLVGIVRDRALGPAIAFGAGGTLVELLGSPAIALPPLNGLLAREMMGRSSAARLLGELRGMRAVDARAVEDVLLRISDLACEIPELAELDINPLIASPEGAIALDARVLLEARPAGTRPWSHLAIAPYPRQLVHSVRLQDGRAATLRPIRPDDARLEQELVGALSFQSKYFRFLRGVSKLGPAELARFTQLDYDRELALLTTIRDERGEHAIGIARYVADPDGTGCEFAIVVADAFQRSGVGLQLMEALMRAARDSGLREMRGEVLAENHPMLGFVQPLGFVVTPHPEDPSLRLVTKPL